MDQAFSLSHDLVPTLTCTVRKLDRRHTRRLKRRDSLLTEEGEGGESNHMIARKPGPLYVIQYSLLLTKEISTPKLLSFFTGSLEKLLTFE